MEMMLLKLLMSKRQINLKKVLFVTIAIFLYFLFSYLVNY